MGPLSFDDARVVRLGAACAEQAVVAEATASERMESGLRQAAEAAFDLDLPIDAIKQRAGIVACDAYRRLDRNARRP